MRLALRLATLALSATAASAHLPRHLDHREGHVARTIASMTYIESYGPTAKVKVYRGVAADIKVRGRFLDLSTGAEARTSGGAATSALSAFEGAKTGGDSTSVVIGISSGDAAPLGTYQVLIHYLVETSGPDKFEIQLFDHGKVDNLSIREPPEVTGTYATGKTYTLRATGSHLENAALFVTKTGIPGLSLAPISTKITPVVSSTVKDFPIRFANGGSFTFEATDFFDQNLPTAPPTNCIDQCYAGNAQLRVQVSTIPVIASVSPTTPASDATVTISGTGLNSPGFNSLVRAPVRYGSAFGRVDFTPTSAGSSLTFAASANMRQDSVFLEYRSNSSSPADPPAFRVRLPNIAVQGGTPVITQLDSLNASTGARHVLVGGTRTLLGRFLAPNPLLPSLTLAIDPSQIPTLTATSTSVQLASIATSAPSSPTIKFGQNDLTVRSSQYFPTAARAGGRGVDSVKFDMFNFTDTISKTLTVSTPFGTTTVANVLAVPPPTIAFIRRRFSNGQTTVVNDGVLLKGATYEVGGVALILTSSGSLLHAATMKLNGTALSPIQVVPTAPGSVQTFAVPTGGASGSATFSVQTLAGSASRTVTIQDPPAQLTIVGFQASPSDVVGGQPITATVALNAAIPAGTSAGTLIATQTMASPSALNLPGPISIRTNPTVFQIPTRVVRTAVTSTITVTNADATGSAASATATVTVRPPSPTAISFNASNIVGGQTVAATVQMNTSATTSDSVAVTFSTDDPTTVTIPPSALLNGQSVVIQVPTRVVPTARTVTINATAGGQTRSATLTVSAPTVTAVTPNPASTVSPSTVAMGITLSAALPSAQTATVACTGQGLTCPTSVSLTASSMSFNVTTTDVPTARTGTVTVTFNGASTSGTLDIQPLAIQSITVSPPSVRGGSSSSFTLQLNRAPGASLTFTFASSDPSAATAPASVTFGPSDITKLVTVNTVASQTTAKAVTITATANRSTALGPATITRTATLTVNP